MYSRFHQLSQHEPVFIGLAIICDSIQFVDVISDERKFNHQPVVFTNQPFESRPSSDSITFLRGRFWINLCNSSDPKNQLIVERGATASKYLKFVEIFSFFEISKKWRFGVQMIFLCHFGVNIFRCEPAEEFFFNPLLGKDL